MLKLSSTNVKIAKIHKQHQNKLKKARISLKKRKYSEFLDLPDQDLSELIKTTTPLKAKYSDIVVIGMGGSILGTQMIFNIFKGPNHNLTAKPRFHFIDTLDPSFIKSLEPVLDKKKSLFIFVSKSGNTLETSTLFALVYKGARKWFGPKWQKHIAIITQNPSGLLHKYAIKDNLTLYEIPKFVGGRYSILTAAGLTPSLLMGIDPKKLLQGAKKAHTLATAERLAALQYHMYKEKKKTSTILFPYINGFEFFNKWAIQLIAESLGKNSKTGPLPVGPIGPSDQHSTLQLLLDGPKDKWVTFFEVEKRANDYKVNNQNFSKVLKAQKEGTRKALDQKNIPTVTLTLDKISEESIGELIQTFEIAVALTGEMLKINPFNQPAVELGKKKTNELLNHR